MLREVDRVFSTYRADSVVSRLGRGEIGLDDCPPEVAEVLALGEPPRSASRGGAFSIRLPGPDGRAVLDPSGVVKGWAVERAAAPLRALPDTDFCLSAGGDMVCRTARPGGPPWRIGIEDPRDPTPGRSPSSRCCTGAVATSGTAHRGQHLVDARTGRPAGRGRLGHRRRRLAHLGRHRRHRRLRAGAGRRPLAARPGRAAPAWWSGPTAPPRRCSRSSDRSEEPAAGRPGAGALDGQDALRDRDLLAAGGQVGPRGVGGAAVAGPGDWLNCSPP